MQLFASLLVLGTALPLSLAAVPHPYIRTDKYGRTQIARNADAEGQADAIAARSSERHFLTSKTAKYEVDGTKIPLIDWDAGESYAGQMPISGDPDEERKLFFWFWPSIDPEAPKEIAIWFNGGPGCSSLIGLITENGPFTWMDGTYEPVRNTYDWRNLTNVMWVEQPVSVGFSSGTPNISNEVQLAKEFVGFYEQFVSTFDMEGFDIYLTGESYAGFYVPYIANEFITVNNPDMPLKGIHINDPIIGTEAAQQAATVGPFVEYWANMLGIDDQALGNISEAHETCGYKDLLDNYFTYPAPQQPFPDLKGPFEPDSDGKCDQLQTLYNAESTANPCFNIYRISDICPLRTSAIGPIDGDYNPAPQNVYFSRSDVQEAINVQNSVEWGACTSSSVFVLKNGKETSDQSLGPALNGVLQNVVEVTNRVIVGSGNLDSLINTNGTLLALQNMTWNGWQGFKEYPGKDLWSPYHADPPWSTAAAGHIGLWGAERGLTFYQIQLAGHMVPGDAPGASFRVLEVLLGRVENLGVVGFFTTESKDFGN